MAAPTEIPLVVTETGADAAVRSMDRLSGSIQRTASFDINILKLSTAVAGLGQIANLAGGDFAQLGNQISQVASSIAGFASIGRLFGPLTGAIGALTGLAVGLAQAFDLIGSKAGAAEDRAQAPRVENRFEFKIGLAGLSADQVAEKVREELRRLEATDPTASLLSPINITERIARTR